MTQLESIKIQRFRGIREGEITDFTDVNILIGRNNCGKSTIAEGICRVASVWGPDREPLRRSLAQLWNTTRGETPGERAPPELWYQNDQSKSAVVSAKIAADTVRLELLPHGPHLDTGTLNPQTRDTVKQFAAAISLFRPPDAYERSIELRLWQELFRKRRDKLVIRALNDIFDFEVEQLQLPPDGRMLVVFSEHAPSLDVQGDGTRGALRCLLVLAALQKTLFILEEPESHQHPGSLERFATAVCQQAKQQEVQLLITTHSIECVQAFMQAAAKAQSESAVFHLTLDNGLLDSRRLEPDTVKKLLETGVDVRCLDLYA